MQPLMTAGACSELSRRIRFAIMGLTVAVATSVQAQKTVDIFFVHSPTKDPERITLYYSMPGWDTTRVARGLAFGDRLPVRQGGRACVRLVDANPMLYTYSKSAEAIQVSPPEGLAILVDGLKALGAASGGGISAFTGLSKQTENQVKLRQELSFMQTRGAAIEDSSHMEDYNEALASLGDALKNIETLRLRDKGDWPGQMAEHEGLQKTASDELAGAEKKYQDAKKRATPAESKVLAQLYKLQSISAGRIQSIGKEFREADSQMGVPLCTKVDKDRMKMTLSVKQRLSEVEKLNYGVSDSMVVLELEPQSDVAFELAPGAMLGPRIPRPKFSVRDGVIASEPDEDPLIRPGIFALGRLWEMGWLWGSIGVTKGKEAQPDIFLGVVARPGLSLVGTQLSIGAGLGLFQVPVRLKGGVVGQPLPADVGDVDKIIERAYRSGLGVTFSLSGFDLTQSDTKK